MIQVALVEPEIPPNTGNVGRLCVATGSCLHLVGRLGFQIDDKSLRRAGMDYWDHLKLRRHATFADLEAFLGQAGSPGRLICFSTKASRPYSAIRYMPYQQFHCDRVHLRDIQHDMSEIQTLRSHSTR